jgi:hypothetical protein
VSDSDKADDMERILDRFGHVQEEYEHLGRYALESQARSISRTKLKVHGIAYPSLPIPSPRKSCLLENCDDSGIHVSGGPLRV